MQAAKLHGANAYVWCLSCKCNLACRCKQLTHLTLCCLSRSLPAGTVDCEYPRWVEFLCHDISVHVPHHVSSKIPWWVSSGLSFTERPKLCCVSVKRRACNCADWRRLLTNRLTPTYPRPQPTAHPDQVQPAGRQREPQGQLGRVHDALHLQLEDDEEHLHGVPHLRRGEELQVSHCMSHDS